MFSSNSSQVSQDAVFIEDIFSTYLFTGTGGTVTVSNGIDMTKGGLYWIKQRSDVGYHYLWDSARGATNSLSTNDTSAQTAWGTDGPVFNNGSITDRLGWGAGYTQATWTFRKQAKFFDVVTYTGNGTTQNISHNLGSTPGCVIVKLVSASGGFWRVWHRGLSAGNYITLNGTGASTTTNNAIIFGNNTTYVDPTSTQFTVGDSGDVNLNGYTYVAYLFAHNAGGFGLTGSDNVISCGSFTTDGSGNFSVNLGYEPQWVMIKSTNNTGVSAAQQNWIIMDTMRGLVTQSGNGARLRANTSEAEATTNDFGPTATGFESIGNMSASAPFIYIAIRRGPMKTPTSGTSVFEPVAATQALNASTPATSSITDDLFISSGRTIATVQFNVGDRLRGSPFMYTQGTDAETSGFYTWDRQTGVAFSANLTSSGSLIMYHMRRAPSFMDVVCYTGNGTSGATQSHNLGVVPEMMIVKVRSNIASWLVYHKDVGNTKAMALNSTIAPVTSSGYWNNTTPTSSVFTLGSIAGTNGNADTFVAYLFASCSGVSKVGSYTGTGTTLQIDCGFTGGARFVLIKRTDSTGDWYVWDSARGIVSGNDPYLLLNSTAAEVTNTDYIDTYSAGFEISSTAPAAINANGGSFIFFAVA